MKLHIYSCRYKPLHHPPLAQPAAVHCDWAGLLARLIGLKPALLTRVASRSIQTRVGAVRESCTHLLVEAWVDSQETIEAMGILAVAKGDTRKPRRTSTSKHGLLQSKGSFHQSWYEMEKHDKEILWEI